MSNHLEGEKSPYLVQHAENPVDWHPWGKEAFRKSKELDRPVFLSIGYSTCHWCHVMAHESFEDLEVAKKLNDTFISIKVDREERPDIDSVYMKASMLATGRGGWPLSIFMTPDGEPFFTATYIPKNARYGMMGFTDLIDRMDHLWKHSRDELLEGARDIVSAMNSEDVKGREDMDPSILEKAFEGFSKTFDTEYGGFGGSPKFPSPHQLFFLLSYYRRTGKEAALKMVETTLENMIRGGLHDHVGGGFHRYSTDRQWLVPHFEKMLYDQAMIMMVMTEAYKATGKEVYRNTIERTYEYLKRDMMSEEGLFYSAEDADSEGVEGKFYVWSYDDIMKVLGKEEGRKFCSHFNVKRSGNFRDEATGKSTGKNILHLGSDPSIEGYGEQLEFLRMEREKRIRPSRDEKVLTDWNAMMISALSRAGQALGDPEMKETASKALVSLGSYLKKDGRWHHRFIDGEIGIDAMLEDLAFLSLAYLDVYESAFDPEMIGKALEVIDMISEEMRDPENGGFYQTSSKGEGLISREKEAYDGASPSGNSAAVWSLIRASRMTGRTDLEEVADRTFKYFSRDLKRAPTGFAMMLAAYMHALGPSKEIVISVGEDVERSDEMIDIVQRTFLLNKVLLVKRPGRSGRELEEIAPFTAENVAIDGRTTAYVCEGWNCDVPTSDPGVLKQDLKRYQT